MKNSFIIIISFFSLYSCNFSDSISEITNGYSYSFESDDNCLNSIVSPDGTIEDFGAFEIKYNDKFIAYSVLDSLYCDELSKSKSINVKPDNLKCKHYIIDVEKKVKSKNLDIKIFEKKIDSLELTSFNK
jgi:hypothetical protein